MTRAPRAVAIVAGVTLPSLVLFAGPQAPQTSQTKTGEPEWIRMDTVPGLAVPIVRARLNGSEGYPFLIDPSVPEVLLDNTLVAGSGMELANRGELQEIDYFGEKEKVSVVYLTALEIGGVSAQGVKGLIVEGDDLARSLGTASYGRIGKDFLEPFRVTIHYPRQLLLLEPSPEGADVPAGGVFFDRDLAGVYVETLLNKSATATFIIDPSVAICLLDRGWARDAKLAEGDDRSVVLDSLQVGGFSASGVPVQLVDMKNLPYRDRPVGVLGASLLLQLSVTYDFSRGLIWLRSLDGG